MAQIKIRYLVVKPGRGGTARYFWQPPAPMRAVGFRAERVPANWQALEGHALEGAAIAAAQALNAKLDAAIAGQPAPASSAPIGGARTIDALVAKYRASDDFKDLRPSTRRGYEQCLDRIGAEWGDAPVLALGASHIQGLKRKMRETPSFANAALRVLRLLLEYGRRADWLVINPALKPKLAGTDPTGLIWPRAAVKAFVAAADKLGRYSIGTAVVLNEWMGQREGDVLRLPRGICRGGTISLRQSKTGVGVSLAIDVVPELVARLEQELERQAKLFAGRKVQPTALIVDEQTGQPYSADSFRHRFAEIRLEAAKEAPSFPVDNLLPGRSMDDPQAFTIKMTDLWFMHLRHTAVTRMAEAGCEIPLIAAVTGHSPRSVAEILDRYLVRTRKLAHLAFEKRRDAETPPAPPKRDEGKA